MNQRVDDALEVSLTRGGNAVVTAIDPTGEAPRANGADYFVTARDRWSWVAGTS